MADKRTMYDARVAKRRSWQPADAGLTNPATTAFDRSGHLDPWGQWQGNIEADIVVVGQEFCDLKTFIEVEGTVERKLDVFEYPANRNLVEYFGLLGFELGHPLSPNANPIYFTNAVMALKDGSMSSNFKDRWLKESRELFLAPLLELIAPKVIIAIGTKATKTLGALYGFPCTSHADMVNSAPIRTKAGPLVFPVFHTGGLGLANRPKVAQIEDWKRIKQWL